jgi:hypothetical protein
MIEGDDAATLMFHLGNYDFSKYEPYAVYHVGYDMLLVLVNKIVGPIYFIKSVHVLNIFFVLINLTLSIDISKNYTRRLPSYVYVLLPILVIWAIPEFVFMSWVIGAPNLALTFVLIAIKIFLKKDNFFIIKVSILMALAIVVRFDFLFALLLIPVFQMIQENSVYLKPKFIVEIVKIATMAVVLAVLLILISLQIIHETNPKITDLKDLWLLIVGVFLLKSEWVGIAGERDNGIITAAGTNTFFTPIFIIISLLGLFFLIEKKEKLFSVWLVWFIIFVVLAQVFGWYYTVAGTIKRTLFLLPFIVIPFFVGMNNLFEMSRSKHFFIFIILLAQTLLGIRIKTNTTTYGPDMSMLNSKEPHKESKFKQISIGVGSGFAFPTEEGTRPLLGFGKSFLDWPNLYKERTSNYSDVLLDTNFVTLIDSRSRLFDIILFNEGFKLESKELKDIGGFSIELHHFQNKLDRKKTIVSFAGGGSSWRAQTNSNSYKLIMKLCQKEYAKFLNYAWVYSSNREHFMTDSKLKPYSSFTGRLNN